MSAEKSWGREGGGGGKGRRRHWCPAVHGGLRGQRPQALRPHRKRVPGPRRGHIHRLAGTWNRGRSGMPPLRGPPVLNAHIPYLAPSRERRHRGLPTQKQTVHVKDEVSGTPRWGRGRGRGRRHDAGALLRWGRGRGARTRSPLLQFCARAVFHNDATRSPVLPQTRHAHAHLTQRGVCALHGCLSVRPRNALRTRTPRRWYSRAYPAKLRTRVVGFWSVFGGSHRAEQK